MESAKDFAVRVCQEVKKALDNPEFGGGPEDVIEHHLKIRDEEVQKKVTELETKLAQLKAYHAEPDYTDPSVDAP